MDPTSATDEPVQQEVPTFDAQQNGAAEVPEVSEGVQEKATHDGNGALQAEEDKEERAVEQANEDGEMVKEEEKVEAAQKESVEDGTERASESAVTEAIALSKLDELIDANQISATEDQRAVRFKVADALSVALEDILQFKRSLKARLIERFSQMAENAVEGDMGEGQESEEGDDEEEEVEEERPDLFSGLPDDWKDMYGKVVWCKSSKKYPWWPAYVYDPTRVFGSPRALAERSAGKKHLVYFYGSRNFDVASPNQIELYTGPEPDRAKQREIGKRDAKSFQQGVDEAETEFQLPPAERVSWNHKEPTRRRRSSGAAKKQPAAKRRRSEAADAGAEYDAEVEMELGESNNETKDADEPEEEEENFLPSDNDDEEEFLEDSDKETRKPKKLRKSTEAKPARERLKKKSELKRPRSSEPKSSREKPAKSAEKKRKSTPAPAPAPVDVQKVLENETRDDRLKRLLDLLNVYTGGADAPAVPTKAVRTFEKIEKMELSMEELKASGAGKAVSKLCKSSDAAIAEAAKQLKNHWTQMVAGAASTPPAPDKAPSTAQTPSAVVAVTTEQPTTAAQPAQEKQPESKQEQQPVVEEPKQEEQPVVEESKQEEQPVAEQPKQEAQPPMAVEAAPVAMTAEEVEAAASNNVREIAPESVAVMSAPIAEQSS